MLRILCLRSVSGSGAMTRCTHVSRVHDVVKSRSVGNGL
jgi:hypothetical protein